MTGKVAIIPAAGEAHMKILPVSSEIPDTMIPINGRPVIGYILAELKKQNFESAVLIVKERSPALRRYVDFTKGDLSVELMEVKQTKGVAHSVLMGMDRASSDKCTVILGDTICFDPLNIEADFAYYHGVRDPSRWCVIDMNADGTISKLVDKPLPGPLPVSSKALIGVYGIGDVGLFSKISGEKIGATEKAVQLSEVFSEYSKVHPITAIESKNWYDCGSPDTYFQTKKKLLSGRSFNTLKIDNDFNTIRKESRNTEKLNDEINWYLTIPEKFKIFSPRMVSYSLSGQNPFLEQEYYGYNTLSELFLFYELSPYVWESILETLYRITSLFGEEEGSLPKESIRNMYLEKTEERLSQPMPKNVKEALMKGEIVIDGGRVEGWPLLKERLSNAIEALYDPNYFSVIHGDLCFSNILCDPNNMIIKLIDPRGRFWERGVFGDKQYEYAKLRHSVSGYDFIINDLFRIDRNDQGISTDFFYTDTQLSVKKLVDSGIRKNGYDLGKIKIIEGTLFLSMIPYHPESERRQMAMAGLGIKLLNEGLNEIGY